ncbi:hypothetical protein HDU93_000707, partial [Gonapodya sp. JEL0774]
MNATPAESSDRPANPPSDAFPSFSPMPTATLFAHLDRIRATQVRLAMDHMALTSLQKDERGAGPLTMEDMFGPETAASSSPAGKGKDKEKAGSKEKYQRNSERFRSKERDVDALMGK